jgi:manganese transport protein
MVTRANAIFPAVLDLSIMGEVATVSLLVATQGVLSLQLPFALVPLIRFTSSRRVMGAYVNGRGIMIVASIAAAMVIACNGWLVMQTVNESVPPAWMMLASVLAIGAIGLLAYLAIVPLRAVGLSSDKPMREMTGSDEQSAECQPL